MKPVVFFRVHPDPGEVLEELHNHGFHLHGVEGVLLSPLLLQQFEQKEERFSVNGTVLQCANIIHDLLGDRWISSLNLAKPLLDIFHDVKEAGESCSDRKLVSDGSCHGFVCICHDSYGTWPLVRPKIQRIFKFIKGKNFRRIFFVFCFVL